MSLAVYALGYPLLTIGVGHRYLAMPTFGVPCPTDILTIGVLLMVRGGPMSLAMVPVLWGFVGGSAALLLGVQTDYALLAAGAALATVQLTKATGRGI